MASPGPPAARALLMALALSAAPALADNVVLDLSHTPTPGSAQLDWAGGLAPFQVYRSTSPASLSAKPNLHHRTNVPSLVEPAVPPLGSAYFYLVLEGRCGDTIVDVNEECDSSDLAGATCQSLGHSGGTLQCTSGCAYDETQCTSGSQFPLMLTRAGSGVITVDGVASCTGSCSQTTQHASGSNATLVAQPQNGSNAYFGGWGGDCSGIARTCVVSMTQARNVTAIFVPIDHNLAFVSSTALTTTRGSAAAYDVSCNQLATTAGLNNAVGNAWVAWMSDFGTTPLGRMGPTARGWIRMDGKPIADDRTSLTTSNVIFHAFRFDELGQDTGSVLVLTGTHQSGVTANNCNNWTGSGLATFGFSGFGPGGWTNFGLAGCGISGRIYCMMKTIPTPLTVTPVAGKRIYLSEPFPPSILVTPQQQCDADKPFGVGPVRPLLATSTTPASAALSPAALYVRLDGVPIGTGAELIAQVKLSSGIWQNGAGNYLNSPYAWTGHTDLTGLPADTDTCEDWSSFFDQAGIGHTSATNSLWFSGGPVPCNTNGVRLYCVEQ